MTHPSKRKGSRFEVEVVHALQRAARLRDPASAPSAISVRAEPPEIKGTWLPF
jgi:hypothetical protein